MLPSTTGRIQRATQRRATEKIRKATETRIKDIAVHPERISERIGALEREWDVDRALFAWAAGVGLVGIGLGAFLNRRFLVLPTVASLFLAGHALLGFCPPVLAMRRLGVRTAGEIAAERAALKALRGDFDQVDSGVLGGGPEEGRGARAWMAAAE